MKEQSHEFIKPLFKGIWSLEEFETNEEVRAIMAKAIKEPNNYVLKP